MNERFQLAQVNIARLLEPVGSALLADFVEALAPINAIADRSPGFVWLQTGCLSLREQPSRSATILRCVENGTRYTIVNGPIEVKGEDWFRVMSLTLGTGWVLAQFLLPGP